MGIYVDNYYYNITGEIVHEIGFKHEGRRLPLWDEDCEGLWWNAVAGWDIIINMDNEQSLKDMQVVFVNRKPAKRGFTNHIRDMQVGEIKPLGDYSQAGVYGIARQIGYVVKTSKHPVTGEVFIRRES